VNRILSKTADPYFVTNHIGAASESFTYTATGKRATMADASGTTTYTYDTRNRLATKATPEGTLSYSYDAASDIKTIQSSNPGGASMAYGYDALDRLSTVTDANGATSYTYDPVGNLGTVTYPNGVAHSYTYDTRNRLTNLGVTGTVSGAPGPIAGYGYTLDAAGHRTSVTELSGRKVNYGYDTIYRLTNETIASDPNSMNGAVSYSYDAVGNRLQKTSTLPGFPGASSTYNANDELTTDSCDADGNTVGSGLNTGTSGYVYDFENRLVQQAGISIVYDADGNRVSKTTANATTQYLVDDLNPTGYAQVMDEVQSSAVTRTYTWGLDLVSERQTLNSTLTTSYYVFDGHGSVRALTNAAGAVTDTYDYDAFGILIHSTGTTPNSYLFAGEQFDPDLNLYYNRARYLNTSTGRFWTMDSFEGVFSDPPSLHHYLYVQAGPVNGIDPSGFDELAELAVEEPIDETLETTTTVSTREAATATTVANSVAVAAQVKSSLISILLFANAIGTSVALKGDNGPGRNPQNGNNSSHRGRLQVQGQDILLSQGSYNLVGHPDFNSSGDTVSWPWNRSTPLDAYTATSKLSEFLDILTYEQIGRRRGAFADASRFIVNASLGGGVRAPIYIPPFNARDPEYPDARVDIES
jgi:RHS repeat-associated protein